MSGHEMRKSALRRYIVFRVKAIEFLDLLVLMNSLLKVGGQGTLPLPSFPPNRHSRFVANSIRTVVLSCFALFIDKSKDGMDAIKLWCDVFPHHATRIQESWNRMQPAWPILREFRDRAGFHADKPAKFFGARYKTRARYDAQLEPALKEFEQLFKFLLKAEETDLKDELEPAVDSLLVDLEKEHSESKFQREQFKAYLMIPDTRSKK